MSPISMLEVLSVYLETSLLAVKQISCLLVEGFVAFIFGRFLQQQLTFSLSDH
jgi:hypothetical protein